MKKAFAPVLTLALCLPLLVSCGRGDVAREKQVLDHVYRYEETVTTVTDATGGGHMSISSPSVTADGFAYALFEHDKDFELTSARIVRGDFCGAVNSFAPPADFTSGIGVLNVQNGVYLYTEVDGVEVVGGEEYYTYTPTLCYLDGQGNEVSRMNLREVFGLSEDDGLYFERAETFGNRQFFFFEGADAVSGKAAIFEDGEFISFFDLPLPEGAYLYSAAAIDAHRLLCVYYDNTVNDFVSLLCHTESGETEKLPFTGYQTASTLFADKDGNFYFADDNGIYRAGRDGEEELLLDFINSDYIYEREHFVALEDGCFAALKSEDDSDGFTKQVSIVILRPADPDSLVPKYIIEVASSGYAYDFQKQIVAFNLSQDEYRIRYTDYAKFNTEDDMEAGQKRLADDLLSGKVPDVLISDMLFHPAKYIEKGLFADLYTYIDNDQTLDRAAFLPNILKGAERDGKLYELPTSFSVYAMAGIEENVKPFDKRTMEEFAAAALALPDGVSFVRQGDMGRRELLNLLFCVNYADFIDEAGKKADFNNAEFKALLDFCRTAPEKSIYEEDGFNFETFDWDAYNNMYKEGKAIAMPLGLSGFESAYSTASYYFGNQKPYFASMPNATGSGYAFTCGSLRLLIAAESSAPDAAWDFVRLFFTKEAQTAVDYYFPVTEEAMAAQRDKALADIRLRDGEDTYYYGEDDYRVTAEDIAALDRIAHEATHAIVVDEDLVNLIYEEATAYFAGEKSFETVAQNLESRVTIKISE